MTCEVNNKEINSQCADLRTSKLLNVLIAFAYKLSMSFDSAV